MISLEQALDRVLASVQPLPAETIPAGRAAGRCLVADVASPIDLPVFDNSAMDGYAVRSADLKALPSTLRLCGRVAAGERFNGAMEPGTCVRVFTGSPVPADADAVAMQEDVSVEGELVRFDEPVRPFENVRLRGEDIRAGAIVGRKGDRIDATRAAILAACGIGQIQVARRPAVTLLATGSELREAGEPLRAVEIYESNRALLAPLLESIGCEVRALPLIRDDLEATIAALKQGFDAGGTVITTGGVSVGECDFVKEAFTRLGGKIDLWRVAVRPGKPFVFGTLGEGRLFGLPGNPVSALVTFLLLVRPALLRMQQCGEVDLPRVPGQLAEAVQNRGDRRHFMRVRWKAGEVTVLGTQASHMIGSLGGANGLIDVPPATRLEAGARVEVRLWQL